MTNKPQTDITYLATVSYSVLDTALYCSKSYGMVTSSGQIVFALPINIPFLTPFWKKRMSTNFEKNKPLNHEGIKASLL